MRSLFSILVAAASCASLGAEITIKAPGERLAVGEYAQILIGGTTPETLKNVQLDVWPAKSALVIPAASWSGEPFLFFCGKEAGDYTLTLTYPDNARAAVVRAVVGVGPEGKWVWKSKDDPNPKPPDPPLPPEPKPGGKKQVAFVIESATLDSLPLSQRSLISSLSLRKTLADKGHLFLWILDKDVRNPEGAVPTAFAPFLGAANGKTLPVMCYASREGGEVKAVLVPGTEAELLRILEAAP